MGFFSKFFRGSNNDDDDFSELLRTLATNQARLEKSVNYNFSCRVLNAVFFSEHVDLEKLYGDEEGTKNVILRALLVVKERYGLRIPPEFIAMPFHFIKNENKWGVVIEVPNARYECECNMIGMIQKKDGSKLYYTNEYYASDNSFGLCLFTDEKHFSLSYKTQKLEEFIEIISSFN